MTQKNRATLKSYFKDQATPTARQFTDLIDSLINKLEDGITITSRQDIGIGTSKPLAKVEVKGTVRAQQSVKTALLKLKDRNGLRFSNAKEEPPALFIEYSGDVGMGTSNPRAHLEVNGRIQDISGSLLPVGAVAPHAGYRPPPGWLICDGSAVSRSQYDDLFKVIGDRFGKGDGEKTFNLPNLKGRVPTGVDTRKGNPEFGTIGQSGGEKSHGLTTAEIPEHFHVYKDYRHRPPDKQTGKVPADAGTGPTKNTHRTGSAGDGQSHNNLQPYLTLNYIIKY